MKSFFLLLKIDSETEQWRKNKARAIINDIFYNFIWLKNDQTKKNSQKHLSCFRTCRLKKKEGKTIIYLGKANKQTNK